MTSTYGGLPASEQWVKKLSIAVGQKLGSQQERERFADLLLGELVMGTLWGTHLQDRSQHLRRLRTLAARARDAFDALRYEINQSFDGVTLAKEAANTLKSRPGPDALRSVGNDEIACYLRTLTAFVEAETETLPRHRGPRNDKSTTIAAAIAWSYHHVFARWPSVGHRGRDPRKSPFDRVCEQVEDLLCAAGHTQYVARKRQSYRFTLSDPARKKGINNAKSGKHSPAAQVKIKAGQHM